MKKSLLIPTLLFGIIIFVGIFSTPASAATRTVDTLADNAGLTACTVAVNDCSLRGAISGAALNDTINFDPSLNGGTITLGSLISIPRGMSIAGPGADLLTISGGNTTSIFEAVGIGAVTVSFSGLTFANGNGVGGSNGGQGGAIEVNSISTAIFDRVVFRDNSAAILAGALLCFSGTCRISNSTFTNNSAPGASVLYGGFGPTEITNTTITGNIETSSIYGCLYLRGNNVIRNSTIANNTGRSNIYVSTENITLTLANSIVAGSAQVDIVHNGGTINTNGGNFIGNNQTAGPTFAAAGSPNVSLDYVGTNAAQLNPQLAPLSNYGGPTPTRALLANSLALDHGNNCVVTNTCSPALPGPLTADQRGGIRQIGAFVDIGAYESSFTFTPPTLPNGDTGFNYDQTITVNRLTSLAAGKIGNELVLAPFTFETVPAVGPTGLPPGLVLESNGQLHGIPTVAGAYTFFIKSVDAADGISGVMRYTVQISVPTAAAVAVSGRVFAPNGGGLTGAMVTMTDTHGASRTVATGSLGYFSFDEVASGESYVISVTSKRYQFDPQFVEVNANITDLSFSPGP